MGSEVIFRGHPVPADIADALSVAGSRLSVFADQVIWHEEIDSTNDAAALLARRGVPEGTVVAANAQRRGRGRLGRTWASPLGSGLYVSLVLRPNRSALSLLTIAAGVALAEGIEAAAGLKVALKWPNDLVVGGRKLGGILSEAVSLADADPVVDCVIVGFGINLRTAVYPPDVEARATSIERELGRSPDRGLVLAECLAALNDRYNALQGGRADGVVAAWRSRASSHMGRHVEWDGDAGLMRGVAQDIDRDGALLVRVGATTLRVISGEVRWL
jgi:BirA family biotin operon repressor/biotin-[acetyl-CoA-carboxylase] ligase